MKGKSNEDKSEPGHEYGELVNKILNVFTDNNFFPSSTAHEKLAHDIQRFGWSRVKVVSSTLSPSKLGRMGFLGSRRLAQLRRDNPDKYVKLVNELDRVLRK